MMNAIIIQTKSGQVDLSTISPDDIVLDDIIWSLSQLPRFVGHLRVPYTVA
jgi:hypothetical protein